MTARRALALCGFALLILAQWAATAGDSCAASRHAYHAHAHHAHATQRPHHRRAAHPHKAAPHHRSAHHTARHSASHHHRRPHHHHRASHRRRSHRAARRPKPLVVIDPGHGGKDPGAIGVAGTLEKTVALKTALELRRQLLATGRYRVAMTRTEDKFVSLSARVAFARKHDASLLIAIHADSSPNQHAHGASVYVRSNGPHGAKLTHVAATSGNARTIGHALAGPPRRPGSALLQYTMIDNLDDDLRMTAEPARRAHFYVLRLHDTPSVLLEMGFLSNRRDEALLKQKKHRRIIARALRDAVNDYFDDLKHATDRT